MMAKENRLVLLGIGSNLQRHAYITLALDAIHERFEAIRISRIFESEPVGFTSTHNFYNLVVGFESNISVTELSHWSKEIEFQTGRRPEDPKYGPRRLDIDILSVGKLCTCEDGVELPRSEILTSAFVLQPLAELYPREVHPSSGLTYEKLWESFEKGHQRLWPIDFIWHGKKISTAQ